MFNILKKRKSTKALLEELRNEKNQLLRLKEILEEQSPKIDISDVYIFSHNGINSIVTLKIKMVSNYNNDIRKTQMLESTLTDIFSNTIVYKKISPKPIEKTEYIGREEVNGFGMYKSIEATLAPICEVEHCLLAYTDKKVPLYVLQQIFYNLNDVDLDDPVLIKKNYLY